MGPLSTALARLLLRPFFGAEEAAAVVEDLVELCAGRGRLGAHAYFWMGIGGYPIRLVTEAVLGLWRNRSTNGGRGGGMDGLVKDLVYAMRTLRRSPGFALMTMSILALSMGAATAIFSVVRGVLLDPLPFPEPDRLVSIWLMDGGGDRHRMTPGNVSDVRSLPEIFSSVAAFQGASAALSTGDGAILVRGGSVTPDYFATLGVQPVVGRLFRQEEGERGGPAVVILGGALWQQSFGGDPGVVGRTVALDGVSFQVVGVVPAAVYPTSVNVSTEMPFTSANQDYFVPMRFSAELWDQRRSHIVGAVARLRDGVEARQADAALETLTARVQATAPPNAGESIVMNPFTDEVVGDVRFALLTLLGTVGLVLMIAVVNVGALFVLRGDDRAGEVDIRLALGAPLPRLVRQLLVESSLIALVASVGAVLLAGWGIHLMKGLVPYQIPRLESVGVDGLGLLITLGSGLTIALFFGLAPAWRMFRQRRDRTRRAATSGPGQRRLQSAVVAFQAGLGVIVLVGAMLLTRSFGALRAVDPGFDALETWVVPVSGAEDRMADIVERVRTVPGVRHAAMAYDHPLERNWGDSFLIEGVALSAGQEAPGGSLRLFGEGYFETAGLRVVEGRVPDRVDLAGDVGYAVVNEALRERYFPDGDVVGAVIHVPTARRNFGEDAGTYTIMGVVGDVRFLGIDTPPQPAFYLPLSHFPTSVSRLLVRPAQAGVEIMPAVRAAIREVAPGAAVQGALRLSDIQDDLLARPRFNMMLLVSFAAMGLLLTGMGAYGLVGRSVVSRVREIGIRMALGADNRSLARSVMGSALRPMIVGGGVGLLAAAVLVRSLRSLLFGITPGDPLSFVASSAFLVVMGALAAVVPALRAVGVDPATTLRSD